MLDELYEAVAVTVVFAVTVPALTVSVPLVDPAAIAIDEGNGNAVELLVVSVTEAPPDGAAPLRVMVTVADEPLTSEVGEMVTLETVGSGGGVSVAVAVLLTAA